QELEVKNCALNDAFQDSDTLILAIKPQDFDTLNIQAENRIIISIMAGVNIKKIMNKLKTNKVIRVMSNLCCLVKESASAFASSEDVTDQEKEFVKNLLLKFGSAIEVKEKLMDAVTGLSGSGTAYVAHFIDSLTEAGKKQGLSDEQAKDLSIQTVLGVGKLMKENHLSAEELISMCSSKGGTTEQGIKVFKNSDFKKIVAEAVEKATEKSKELGK
ncbi:MAG: pyrroline-5-carboxylate reductase, partial [Candidatus Woesearchaeota archaeon]|nr:pyrroline-5-carboxylate reductase [Candidatus Woesearchaeota archaeon]